MTRTGCQATRLFEHMLLAFAVLAALRLIGAF